MPYIISGGIAGGCAIPGVMSTRTMRSPKEKLATMLTMPYMALLFTASFFYFMSMTREMCVAGTKTYGAFMALAETRKKADTTLQERLHETRAALTGRPAERWGHDARGQCRPD